MTKFASLILLAAGAAAQQAINTTVASQILQALQAAGLTKLAAAAESLGNSTTGNQLLSTITNGDTHYTVFAPSNSAIDAANQTALSNPEQLATIISYHVVPGNYGNSSAFFASPNNTIIRTLLNSTDFVRLGGNARQVLSANVRDGAVYVNNQNGTLKVNKSDTVSRFSLLQIDRVLSPPASLATVARQNNLTLFAQAAEQAGLLNALANANGVTVFAPTDAALTAALASLGNAAQNTTLIQTILLNHVVNGTAVYSSEFDNRNLTSAAGQALNFRVSADNIMVYSGSGSNITANITTRDVLTSNGVIHVIDGVLANTARDDGAASSAYSSATSAAASATPTGDNGPVGGGPNDQGNNGNDNNNGNGGNGGNGSGAGVLRASIAWTAVVGAGMVGVLAATTL